MANLKEVRNRISSVKNTQKITKAMKVVSAAKLRKAQGRIVQMRPYADAINQTLSHLGASSEGLDVAKLYEDRGFSKVLIILVTSDRGLAGSFNSSIIKETLRHIEREYRQSSASIDIVAIGKKGKDVISKVKGLRVVSDFSYFFNNLTYAATEEIATDAIDDFLNGEYDRIEIAYNQFRNASVYIPSIVPFLPVPSPVKGEEVEEKKEPKMTVVPDYIFEPDRGVILDALIRKSLKVNLFRTLLESNAAEHGARMTAMDKASDNADDLLKALKLAYNKERQATITNEILEIVGGAAALNG